MNLITYNFSAWPHEFLIDEFLKDPKMMYLLRYLVYIIRPKARKEVIRCNGYHEIELQPYEFIYSRKIFMENTGLTEREVRTRIERLLLGKKSKRPGVSSKSFIQKTSRSFGNQIHVYRVCTENFTQNKNTENVQEFSNENVQEFGPVLIYNNRNDKESRFLEKENVEKEKEARPVLESKPKSPPPENPKIVRGEFNAFLLHKERQEELDVFDMICEEHGYKILREDFRKWRNRYSLEQIMRTLDLMLIAIKKQKRPIESHVRWMQTALKEDWVAKEDRIKMNKAYAKEFKEKNRIKRLLVLEQYCRDEMTGNDYQYFLAHEQFKKLLEDKFITYRGQNS